MDLNDLEPKNVKPNPINLEVMSIEALYDYIGELEDEINRTKNEISAKEVARKGAEEETSYACTFRRSSLCASTVESPEVIVELSLSALSFHQKQF